MLSRSWMVAIALVVFGASAMLLWEEARAQTARDCAERVQTSDWVVRRRQAIQLARDINTSQARAGRFVPLAELQSELSVPGDFSVKLHGSPQDGGADYIFSISDVMDRCNVLFSDQRGVIYVGQPLN